jgi:hypothetical protein
MEPRCLQKVAEHIAAKHADIFQLPPLLDDPEEAVRWNAARRLPKRYVLRLRTDPHREVRIRVVSLLEDAGLIPMLLVKNGDAGEIVQVGSHTESNTPIYLVEFTERLVVGCLEEEIMPL